MTDERECFQNGRLDRLEERVNKAEQRIASISTELESTRANLSQRITDINENLKEDVEGSKTDLRERLSDLKEDLKEDIRGIDSTIRTLSDTMTSVKDSLQNLYVSSAGSKSKVNYNEKVIWVIIVALGTAALYILQAFLKSGAAG